jgi:hypothetical protein
MKQNGFTDPASPQQRTCIATKNRLVSNSDEVSTYVAESTMGAESHQKG